MFGEGIQVLPQDTRQISALPLSPTDFGSLVGHQARTVLRFLYEWDLLTTLTDLTLMDLPEENISPKLLGIL